MSIYSLNVKPIIFPKITYVISIKHLILSSTGIDFEISMVATRLFGLWGEVRVLKKKQAKTQAKEGLDNFVLPVFTEAKKLSFELMCGIFHGGRELKSYISYFRKLFLSVIFNPVFHEKRVW